jgi:broad-specificity NMP kinase
MDYQRLFKQVQAMKAKVLDCDRDAAHAPAEVQAAFLIVRSYYHDRFKQMDALLVEEVQRLFDKRNKQEFTAEKIPSNL